MPTLTIEGRKVPVGDEFLQLSPEEQNATVDEIAQTLKNEAIAARGKQGPAEPSVGLPQSIAAAIGNGMMLGAGPYIAGASEYTANLGAPGSFDRGKQQYIEQQTVAHDSNPVAYNISDVAGGFLTPIPFGGARAAVRGAELGLRGAGPIVRAAALPAAAVAGAKAAPAGLWAIPVAAGATYRGVRGAGARLSRMGEALRDSRVTRGAARDARRTEQTAPAAGRVEPQFAEPPPAPTNRPNMAAEEERFLANVLREVRPNELARARAANPNSRLTDEMLASLQRNKFRHQYRTD